MAGSENIFEATDANFETEILKSDTVTLVDFWAEWCGPCKQLGPTIEAVAEEFAGKAKVFKMNVDENPSIPGQFQIRSIPTVIIFKNGSPVEQLIGNQPKDVYQDAIKNQI